MSDFNISKSGLVFGAEVDELFATIDETLLPKLLEGVVDRINDLLVKGKGKAIPVTGCTESS